MADHYSSNRNSTTSSLLRLPAELRNHIYQYALRVNTITIYDHGAVDGGQTLTSLPRVCRQLYKETSTLIFSLNSFTFSSRAIAALLDRARPAQLQALRSIRLQTFMYVLNARMFYWKHCETMVCYSQVRCLANLPGLRQVDVMVDVKSQPRRKERAPQIKKRFKEKLRDYMDLESKINLKARLCLTNLEDEASDNSDRAVQRQEWLDL